MKLEPIIEVDEDDEDSFLENFARMFNKREPGRWSDAQDESTSENIPLTLFETSELENQDSSFDNDDGNSSDTESIDEDLIGNTEEYLQRRIAEVRKNRIYFCIGLAICVLVSVGFFFLFTYLSVKH